MDSKTVVIDVEKLHKSFGGVDVLKGVDFKVMRGQTISVLGSSGSGKSTLLRCINWLEQPDSGAVRICGTRMGVTADGKTALSERELARLRARTAMVFQGFNLWPHLTVLQNVIEAPIHVQGTRREQAIESAHELLNKVGMQHKADVYPFTLSGGQKQRVAIARALAMCPEVILFDEPTSALDPELVGEVQSVIRALAEDGYTMVIVTHEMEFARTVSHEVVFLERGQVIERATSHEFFDSPKTERVRQFLKREH